MSTVIKHGNHGYERAVHDLLHRYLFVDGGCPECHYDYTIPTIVKEITKERGLIRKKSYLKLQLQCKECGCILETDWKEYQKCE